MLKSLYDDVHRIETEGQSTKWLSHLLGRLQDDREAVSYEITVSGQRKAERRYLIQYGTFMGVLRSLHACGKLGDVGYENMRRLGEDTLRPVVVGVV